MNRRTDGYGGSVENRMRFPLEVVEAVRAAWPEDRPLFVRVSAVDASADGTTLEETVAFARELAARGVDAVAHLRRRARRRLGAPDRLRLPGALRRADPRPRPASPRWPSG